MPKYLTAIIIDDEHNSREAIHSLIRNTKVSIEVIAECQNAQQGLESIIDANPDMIFLDIQMPVNDGFWLADKLHAFKKRPYIIFITAFDKFAIEAIKHSAFDFLVKPIAPDEFISAVKRVEKSIGENKPDERYADLKKFLEKKKLRLNTIDGFFMISVDDIVFCEADGNYTYINLVDGKRELITSQIGKLEELLTNNFVRINRSVVINTNMIEKVRRKNKLINLHDGFQKYEFTYSKSGLRRLNKNTNFD